MKYIDADLLRKAVEKKYNSNDTVGDRWDLGYDTACEQILDTIDSLQQEEPEEVCIFKPNMTIDEMKDSINGKQQEQQEEDLEKGFSIAWARHPIPKEFIPDLLVKHGLREFIYKTARHFYELGKNSK